MGFSTFAALLHAQATQSSIAERSGVSLRRTHVEDAGALIFYARMTFSPIPAEQLASGVTPGCTRLMVDGTDDILAVRMCNRFGSTASFLLAALSYPRQPSYGVV